MIDHISLSVLDFAESKKFYDQTLSLIGYQRLLNFEDGDTPTAGYGKDGKPAFWIAGIVNDPSNDEIIGKSRGFHVCFLAENAESINRWHAKCLELGGKDNGAPGPRTEYHPGYYGGFIIDPNGWRIEAVIHHFVA